MKEYLQQKNSLFGGSISGENQFFLERPRVNALLEKAIGNPVVLIIAGEGHGKTHAVYSFLRRKKMEAAWVSLSQRDNDPSHFWENVINAMSICNPRLSETLEEISFPESPSQLNRCISALQEAKRDNKKIIVVADDCNLVHEKAILKFFLKFVANPIPGQTIVLISRTELAVNTMPLLSKGFLSRIAADDLRFNEEEIGNYFRFRNIPLSAGEQSEILEDTEGWALAISLIADEMKKERKRYNRALFENGIFKNMEEALFASIPASLQRFLIILSLFEQWPLEALEKIASSLPEKLPPMNELNENMKQLSAIIRYDSYLHGFRIHRIFLDYLRKKQNELSKEEIKTACVISAQWCMENRLWIDAAINYGMAGDYEGLIKAIYSFPRLLSRRAAASILEILNRVLKDEGRNEKDKNFLFLRHVTRTGMLANLRFYAESRSELEKSIREFEALPPSPESSWILSACYSTLGAISILSYRETRDIGRATEYFQHGCYYYMRHPFTISGSRTRASIGSYANPIGHPPRKGEYEAFISVATEIVPYASKSAGGYLSGADSLCWAEFAFFKGDLNTAEQQARKAASTAREKGQCEVESKSLFYLLRIHLCNGNSSACRETWEQMKALLDNQEYINRYAIHDIMTGWFYAHAGETEEIAPWLKNEFEESDLNLFFHNFETMVKAKSLFAEKKYHQALKFLGRKEVREGLGSFHLGALEITALKAAIHNRMKNEAAALKTLETAYVMSVYSTSAAKHSTEDSSETFDMPFIELGEDMRTLAGIALNSKNNSIPRPWLETIRNKASVYGKKLTRIVERHKYDNKGKKVPFLTSQELAILTGISKGFTREKIAHDTSLSPSIVKNMIKTIYDKLGAFNRADAIRIATKAGLLKL